MSNITKRFELKALSAAIMASQSLGAFAQTAEEAPSADSGAPVIVEEVIVTGIRGSLQRSIDDKRNAQQIMDTINAEDIGKNTDQNIADSLGRVTGVSIVTRNGEGSQVTVRGASANQNNISLNGQQLTSTDFSQAVDLSSFSSDILSKLEVIKTPSADQDEGSLGASINLVTVRPLDRAEDIRSVSLQGRYNEFSEETDYKVQLSLSETFLDDSVGVAFTLFDETNTTRRDQYRVEDFRASNNVDLARDQDGNIISGVRAIEHSRTFYEQIKNVNDRQGGTLGIQWAISEDTEIMFNGTYTKQDEPSVRNAFRTNTPSGVGNFSQGQLAVDLRGNAPFSDPQQDLYTIDTRTNTFIKNINRFGSGDVVSAIGGDERENLSATIDFTHNISDSFRVAAKVGYSNSTSESLPNAFAVMQNFTEAPSTLHFDAGRDIQPVGYDCTSGRCNLVFGSHFVDLGTQIDDEGATRGSDDNISLTGYNPADITSQNLSFLSENAQEIEDELANIQLDFDWDIDVFGITTLEFGGKLTQREKFVDDQQFNFNSITRTEVFVGDNGQPVASRGGALSAIRGSFVAIDGLEYDDFMESLGYDAPGSENWVPFDGVAAKNLVLEDENTIRTPNNSETRRTDIDTSAFYLKANFSFLDDRLTGDIGVRYVKTDIDATGFGGVDFHQGSETLQREFSFLDLRELRNRSLPECFRPNDAANVSVGGDGYQEKFQRIDGTGFDTSSGPDPSGWTPIPAQEACHDPDYADWFDFQIDQRSDNPSLADPGLAINWYTMWRYADISTVRDGSFTNDPNRVATNFVSYDPSVQAVDVDNANAYTFINPVDRELASFRAANSHSYTNVLPNLNINFAFTDELVGRFAISQTMTRPEIDLIQPGFGIDDGPYWTGDTPFLGRFEQFNTRLDPLESNNLDVSVEWYFSDTGVVSAALFYKDLSNFTNIESAQVYSKDLRSLDQSAGISPDDLILIPTDDASNDFGLAGCQPLRFTADAGFNLANDFTLSSDARDLCLGYNLERVTNGDGATIAGLELGYTQTYDFLPGYFLSGLGVSANYTFQDSEYDEEFSTVFTDRLLPTLPVADTPEHTYNFTTFWEQDGHQVRLSYRGSSDSLLGTDFNTGLQGRTWRQGTLWNEGRDQLDLSASYAINDSISVTFQAVNLTDESFRTYFTSRTLDVLRVAAPITNENPSGFAFTDFEEGNPLDGDGSKSRTYTEFKTGIGYRLELRAKF